VGVVLPPPSHAEADLRETLWKLYIFLRTSGRANPIFVA
jgi:hypothetical protein